MVVSKLKIPGKKLDDQEKRNLIQSIKRKLLGKTEDTYSEIGKKFGISLVMMNKYTLVAKHEIEIERIKEEYETELRKWKKQIVSQSEKEDGVLQRLYMYCMDGEFQACIAWLRASGHFKAAEVRAKKSASGEDELDWQKVVSDMMIDEVEYE